MSNEHELGVEAQTTKVQRPKTANPWFMGSTPTWQHLVGAPPSLQLQTRTLPTSGSAMISFTHPSGKHSGPQTMELPDDPITP
jgi:hypothetical protein